MTGHLTLFFSIIFSHFNSDLTQIRKVLDKLFMI